MKIDFDLLAYGQRVMASQPFSVLLGATLSRLTPGFCELRVPIGPALQQQHGFAHGGVISYVADNALTFAGGSAMQVPVVTSELKVSYVRPARGTELIGRAKCVIQTRTQAVCSVEVFVVTDGVEKLCALGQGTVARLPGPNHEGSGVAESNAAASE